MLESAVFSDVVSGNADEKVFGESIRLALFLEAIQGSRIYPKDF
jgi:hypothetical protein